MKIKSFMTDNGQSSVCIENDMPRSTSGCYGILCISANKVYIGSTSNLRRRKTNHLYDLRRGYHPNADLQSDFNRYGELGIVFFTLKRCDILSLERVEGAIAALFNHNNLYNKHRLITRRNKTRLEINAINPSDNN